MCYLWCQHIRKGIPLLFHCEKVNQMILNHDNRNLVWQLRRPFVILWIVYFFLLLMAGESPPPLDLVKLSKCVNVAKKTAKRKVQFLWVITNSLDILLMLGAFQSEFLHEVPKNSLDIGPRINFTFRNICKHHTDCQCCKMWSIYY